MSDYMKNIQHLTLMDVSKILLAAESMAKWGNHSSSCSGYADCKYTKGITGKDEFYYDDIPANERHKYFAIFDKSKCDCGLEAMCQILYSGRMTKIMEKSLVKGGFIDATGSDSRAVITDLRQKLNSALEELELKDEQIRKLENKLGSVAQALKAVKEAGE